MTAQVIPTGDDPFYEQTCTLDGVPYLLTFFYNQREDRWYLLLSTVDGDPIYGAVKLVPNWPLFAQCVDGRAPPGQFVVVSASQTDDSPPGLEELVDGARCQLLYIPAADVAVAIAPPPATVVQPSGALSQLLGNGAPPLVLDGMLAALPGLSVLTSGTHGALTYSCAPNASVAITIGGDPGYTYAVQVRIRGVVEQKTITGGTAVPGTTAMVLGGTPAADNSSIASLVVSAPAQTFYLNAGTSGGATTEGIDNRVTLAVQGGATVTLTLNSVDSIEDANNTDGQGGSPVVLPGLLSPAQPYVGQFLLLNVGAVT